VAIDRISIKERTLGRSIVYSLWLAMLLFFTNAYSQKELYVEQLQSVEVFKAPVFRGAVSSKANLLAVLSPDKALRFFEIPSLKEKLPRLSTTSNVNGLSFSASGKTLALGAIDGRVYLYDLMSGSISKSLSIHPEGIRAVVFQDEGWIFSAGADKTVAITDAVSGSAIGSLPSFPEEITALAIQPDATNGAVGLSKGQVNIFSIGTLSTVSSYNDAKDKITALCYSADGKYLAAGTADGYVFLWNVQTGIIQGSYTHRGVVGSVVFDPKTRWIVSTANDHTISFFDLTILSTIKTIVEHDGYATYADFLNDETLVTGTSTGLLKSWKVALAPPDSTNPGFVMEQPAAGMVPAKAFAREYELRGLAYDDVNVKEVSINGIPVALTAISAEDAAKIPAGMKSVKRFSTVLKLDSVGPIPYEIKVSDKANHTTSFSGEIYRLSNDQAVEIESPENNTETGSVSIPLKFRTWFDIASYSISSNMVDIVSGQVPEFKVAGDTLSEDIPIVLGYNQIQLSITSKTGDKFSKTMSVNRTLSVLSGLPPVSVGMKKGRTNSGPQRWAVVVGVSEYKNPGIPSLKYADKDAESLAKFLRRPEGGGYDSNHMRVLLNKDATLANVRDALINFLNQAIDMDLVLIYFAGHGAPEPARPQNMYLLTYDSDPTALGTTAFPMWDIQTVLSRYINAKRVIVFSDACHSGNISVNFATRGVGISEQNLVNQYLSDLSKSKEGVVVFTASASGEVSQEFPEMAHGVFTYYLLQGMEGKADYDNDYTVTINELMQYVEEQVKRKTRGSQNPTRSQTSYDKEMSISILPH
jgi:WD40 repeat protein